MSDRRGSIAVMFALLLVPMIGAVGLAIDYSRLLALRSTAQTAADGAALMAANIAKEEASAAGQNKRSKARAVETARRRGQDFFDSYALNITSGSMTGTVQVVQNGQQLNARVDYVVTLPTTLGRVLGHTTMMGSASSGTLASLPLHYDIHLMLDVSQSMGLGATRQDMQDLYIATGAEGVPSCAFGCHVKQNSSFTTTNSKIARDNKIRMRIDVLKDAVGDLVAQAQAGMNVEGIYRVSLNTFSNQFRELQRMTGNMSAVLAASTSIDLGPNVTPGFSDTDYDHYFPRLTNEITTNTDGLSSATALQFVFIITDGVRNVNVSKGWRPDCYLYGHCTAPIDPTLCQEYKDRGATVGVIYTTYLPIELNPTVPNSGLDHRYEGMVKPFADQIAPALKDCASPGWFFEAAYESDIRAALAQLFEQVTSPPTLTN